MVVESATRCGSFLASGISSLFPDRTWNSISDASLAKIFKIN